MKKNNTVVTILIILIIPLAGVGLIRFAAPHNVDVFMNPFTGATKTCYQILDYTWTTHDDNAEYSTWARKHKTIKSTYYTISHPTLVYTRSRQKWFERSRSSTMSIIFNIVEHIYQQDIPEHQKIQMLNEFHTDINSGLKPFISKRNEVYTDKTTGKRLQKIVSNPAFEKWNTLLNIN